MATLGLSQEEAERQAVAGPPDGRRARAIGISYRYGPEARKGAELIAQPSPCRCTAARTAGTSSSSPGSELDLGEEITTELEPLAELAGPAIGNALRFQEAQQRALSTR